MTKKLIGVYHGEITIKEHKVYVDAWLTQEYINYNLVGDPKTYHVRGLMKWNGTGKACYNIARDFVDGKELFDTEIGKIIVTSWSTPSPIFEFVGSGEPLNFTSPEESDLIGFKRWGMCRVQNLD